MTFDANFDMIASVVAIHQEELSKADLAGDERFIQQNEKVGFLMKQFTYTIQDSMGIYARPAGLLVNAVRALDSEVTVTKGAKTVGGAKLIALMGLGVKCGDTITVTVSGGDERASENALKEFLEKNL